MIRIVVDEKHTLQCKQVTAVNRSIVNAHRRYYDSNPICAICRKHTYTDCQSCEAKAHYFPNANHVSIYPEYKLRRDASYMERQMLALAQEGNSLMYKMPKQLIAYILDLLPIDVWHETCGIEWGECRHAFHTHCIRLWRAKRDACPLCNGPWTVLMCCSQEMFEVSRIPN